MNLRQAAQQALEALENVTRHFTKVPSTLKDSEARGEAHKAITTLRAALAEEALQRLTDVSQEIEAALAEPEQEPVVDCPRCGHCCPERKPLTEEQNFCPRCGKRTNDIHTCTPPQDWAHPTNNTAA